MSVNSYSTIDFSFPKSSQYNEYCELAEYLTDDGDRWKSIGGEGDGRYVDGILDEVLELFDGKRLDMVPGLELELTYQCFDDEPWYCTVSIKDGEVECQEAVMTWRECTLEDTFVDIGQPNVKKAREAWDQLTDVLVDDDGNILDDLRMWGVGWWPKGTNREDVWRRIEKVTHVSVAWLMGEAKNHDGTND